MEINKRFDQRHVTLGLMSSVSDGKNAFMGVVEDISLRGMRLSNVPADFDDTVDPCFIVVKGPTRDFKVFLHPRWTRSTNHGMYKDIGFQINDPPHSWERFVDQLTDENNPLHTLFGEVEMEM